MMNILQPKLAWFKLPDIVIRQAPRKVFMQKFIIHSDGGSRGNPGPAAYGYLIESQSPGSKNIEGSKFIGEATNNQAEYQGILAALKSLKVKADDEKIDTGDICIECLLDSQLIVEQMNGNYKIKNEGLKPLFWRIKELIMELGGNVSFKHIPREENKEADKLVNEAIDKHLSK